MKVKVFYSLLLILSTGLFLSCGQGNVKSVPSTLNTESNVEQIVNPEIYEIEGEDIIIRVGPGENFDKLINQKATEALGKTHYAQVDYTVKVTIEETNGDWSKIKVVEPDWLSSTHIGWIPSKSIIMEQKDDNKLLEKLDPETYEIIKTDHKSTVHNYHLLIKYPNFDKEYIFDFIAKFRNEYCTKNCNIMVYDTKSILHLIDKYPLEGKEYIELADHFVAMSSFDAPKLKSWYPYQDFQYRDYGGKNWKTEPIK
jgi:hypothetical protein